MALTILRHAMRHALCDDDAVRSRWQAGMLGGVRLGIACGGSVGAGTHGLLALFSSAGAGSRPNCACAGGRALASVPGPR